MFMASAYWYYDTSSYFISNKTFNEESDFKKLPYAFQPSHLYLPTELSKLRMMRMNGSLDGELADGDPKSSSRNSAATDFHIVCAYNPASTKLGLHFHGIDEDAGLPWLLIDSHYG